MSDIELGQQVLFNEAEDGCTLGEDSVEEDAGNIITVPEHKRKKKGRKPLPKDLPREEVVHDLSDEEKRCPCCNTERPCIGEKTSENLDIIPAQIKVIKHIYPKYGPCSCEEFKENEISEVVQKPAIPRIIPKSIVSPGLLAHILISKFADALPFYRQEKIFARIGVDIPRATMCNWTIHASGTCSRLLELLWEDLLNGPLIQMDETSLQVLKEPDKSPDSKSYMWVTVGYPEVGRVILFHYHPCRKQRIPFELLKNYQGFLQTDGYDGYNAVSELPGITHVGCCAHARRNDKLALMESKSKKTTTLPAYLHFYFPLYFSFSKTLKPFKEVFIILPFWNFT
jgi:transposase